MTKLFKTYSEIVCDTGVEMGRVARGCEGRLMLRSVHISSRTRVLKSFTLVLWIMKFACFAMAVTAMFLAVAAKQPHPVDGSAALTATMPFGSQTACHGFLTPTSYSSIVYMRLPVRGQGTAMTTAKQ